MINSVFDFSDLLLAFTFNTKLVTTSLHTAVSHSRTKSALNCGGERNITWILNLLTIHYPASSNPQRVIYAALGTMRSSKDGLALSTDASSWVP